MRPLHYVFKIGNRAKSTDFFTSVLGMKVLRHEEFDEGCKATCNGPYDGKWSKTMVGYGPEDEHFVLELTYNYGIRTYQLGDDFKGVTIRSSEVRRNVREANIIKDETDSATVIRDPDGRAFFVQDAHEQDAAALATVSIGVSSLDRSAAFWSRLCGLREARVGETAVLASEELSWQLELRRVDGGVVERGTAFGRLALSCRADEVASPSAVVAVVESAALQLAAVEAAASVLGARVLTPLVSLDTPGKATVQVIILADPDGHEMCVVGDEAFRQLSQVDEQADAALRRAIAADDSDDWFDQWRGGKPTV